MGGVQGTRMTSLYEVDGSKLKLNFHPGQTRAWDSTARFVAVIAGSQSGKTSWGPWWLWREINNCGSGDYLAVTGSFDLFKLKLLPEMRAVFEHTLGIGKFWAGDQVLEIRDPVSGKFLAKRASDPMYARILLRSASAPSGLESATAKAAWLDEAGLDAFTLESWEAIRRRLSLFRGRVLITTTPYNLGWLKQQIVDKDGKNGIEVISFPSIYNPAFSREEFEERQATMPKWRFDMFYRGLFARPVGLIYNDFIDEYKERGGHKVTRAYFDSLKVSEMPRYVGVDPGAVNTAMVWLAHDTVTDVYYLYRESLEGGKSTPEHARGAVDLASRHQERVVRFFVGQKAEVQVRLDWQQAGVYNVAEPSVHEVESGIDRVIQLFKQHRLYVVDDCAGVLDELGRYARVVGDDGEPTDKIKDKDSYHRLDALRYAGVGVTTPQGIGFM